MSELHIFGMGWQGRDVGRAFPPQLCGAVQEEQLTCLDNSAAFLGVSGKLFGKECLPMWMR